MPSGAGVASHFRDTSKPARSRRQPANVRIGIDLGRG
jgi:hypothetical protein